MFLCTGEGGNSPSFLDKNKPNPEYPCVINVSLIARTRWVVLQAVGSTYQLGWHWDLALSCCLG